MKFLDALAARTPLVVVDNTNSQRWEYAPYAAAARACGYAVRVVEITVRDAETLRRVNARNQHGVPLEAAQAMLARWEVDPEADCVEPAV